ncbi:MAG: hypothetical protein A3K19_05180 [Lentisphaerae bacterium RIFOXYB12_FULL_65_16]|nr:MAG: hypothetical protein A3K18_35165 [Lentisphaerae bacterium RIFOXYA12_64_32]OGV89779.1 MAG: hypothetical protein A3K19_05180 [Lentisphaerae bacterium RIFOXYB12_FULL_65_16]
MHHGFRALLAAAILTVASTLCAEDGFLIRLGVKNGHIREVFIGCAQGATAGYDQGHDDLAPPRGIQTGYTVLMPPDKALPPLYKDVRAPGDGVTWNLLAEVYTGKPIRIDWSMTELPNGYRFGIETTSGVIDMRAADHLELTATETLKITATRQATEAAKGEKKEGQE